MRARCEALEYPERTHAHPYLIAHSTVTRFMTTPAAEAAMKEASKGTRNKIPAASISIRAVETDKAIA